MCFQYTPWFWVKVKFYMGNFYFRDAWHVICETGHMTCDMWHLTHGGEWTLSQNSSSLALTVWEEKDHSMNEWIIQWQKCLSLATTGLFKRSDRENLCTAKLWLERGGGGKSIRIGQKRPEDLENSVSPKSNSSPKLTVGFFLLSQSKYKRKCNWTWAIPCHCSEKKGQRQKVDFLWWNVKDNKANWWFRPFF